MLFPHRFHHRHRAPGGIFTKVHLILIAFSVLIFGMRGFAQNVNPIRIDASAPFSEPTPASYNLGSAKSPTGSLIGLNSRYLTLNGTPWTAQNGNPLSLGWPAIWPERGQIYPQARKEQWTVQARPNPRSTEPTRDS
jgi:hypothetical protein